MYNACTFISISLLSPTAISIMWSLMQKAIYLLCPAMQVYMCLQNMILPIIHFLVVIVHPKGRCNIDPQSLRDCYARGAVNNGSKLSLFQVLLMSSKSQANSPYFIKCPAAWMAQSVQRLATGWTVRGSKSSRGEVFRIHQYQLRGPPSFLCDGCLVSFPGVKRPRRGANHPPHFSAGVEYGQSYTCLFDV